MLTVFVVLWFARQLPVPQTKRLRVEERDACDAMLHGSKHLGLWAS